MDDVVHLTYIYIGHDVKYSLGICIECRTESEIFDLRGYELPIYL